MREDNKIVFTGPVGVGKTTAISSISDSPIVSTDAKATDMTVNRKGHTTVAMDYGIMKLGGGEKVHLYGTPGQERFDFMWDILTTGGLGLILMLDNTRPTPKKDMQFFLNSFKDYVAEVPLVIGVSKLDIKNSPGLDEYYAFFDEVASSLKLKTPLPPIYEVDGRNKNDIKTLVMSLLFANDPGI